MKYMTWFYINNHMEFLLQNEELNSLDNFGIF